MTVGIAGCLLVILVGVGLFITAIFFRKVYEKGGFNAPDPDTRNAIMVMGIVGALMIIFGLLAEVALILQVY